MHTAVASDDDKAGTLSLAAWIWREPSEYNNNDNNNKTIRQKLVWALVYIHYVHTTQNVTARAVQ